LIRNFKHGFADNCLIFQVGRKSFVEISRNTLCGVSGIDRSPMVGLSFPHKERLRERNSRHVNRKKKGRSGNLRQNRNSDFDQFCRLSINDAGGS